MANVSFNGNVVNPDLKFTNSGKAVFRFSVPENHKKKNQQSGQYEETGTTWWRCNFWGNALFTPEALAEAAQQGAFVNVIGRTETRKYEKDGEEKEAFEVTAETVGIMPKAPRDGQQGGGAPQQSQQAPAGAWGNQGQQQWGGQPQQQAQWGGPQQGAPAPF